MPRYARGRPFDLIRDIKDMQKTVAKQQTQTRQSIPPAPWIQIADSSLLSGWVHDPIGITPSFRLNNESNLLEIVGRIKGPPTPAGVGASDLYRITDPTVTIVSAQSRLVTIVTALNAFQATDGMPRLFINSGLMLTFFGLPDNTTNIDLYCQFSIDA